VNSKEISAEQIKLNYQSVQDRMSNAARRSGRNPGEVKLVAVSKEKPVTMIDNAIKAGLRIFGENYADEALPKIDSLRKYPDIRWHMIGHVQSRKAQIVINNFDYLHSLDSVKLARRLDRFASDSGKILPALLEFNLSGEGSKFGFPAWHDENWMEFIPSIEEILDLSGISIRGLMTIPPFSMDPEDSRPYYKKLCRLQGFLQQNFPAACWIDLSMGMSSDFEIAIEEGATWIRVGQALLGRRD
jgi:pyridoxal phosphate enzyme (YggS family)